MTWQEQAEAAIASAEAAQLKPSTTSIIAAKKARENLDMLTRTLALLEDEGRRKREARAAHEKKLAAEAAELEAKRQARVALASAAEAARKGRK